MGFLLYGIPKDSRTRVHNEEYCDIWENENKNNEANKHYEEKNNCNHSGKSMQVVDMMKTKTVMILGKQRCRKRGSGGNQEDNKTYRCGENQLYKDMDSVETKECDYVMDTSAYNGYQAGNMMNSSTEVLTRDLVHWSIASIEVGGNQYNTTPYFSKDHGVCKDSSPEKGG